MVSINQFRYTCMYLLVPFFYIYKYTSFEVHCSQAGTTKVVLRDVILWSNISKLPSASVFRISVKHQVPLICQYICQSAWHHITDESSLPFPLRT